MRQTRQIPTGPRKCRFPGLKCKFETQTCSVWSDEEHTCQPIEIASTCECEADDRLWSCVYSDCRSDPQCVDGE